MAKLKEIYKCEICGNIVEILHAGSGTLVCCNQDMILQNEKIQEQRNEKHIPIIEKNEKGVLIKVSSISHPMDEDHYIEWIEISTEKGESKKFLKPGEKPEAVFPVKSDDIKSRAYCNIHGLWKSQ